MCQGCLDRNIDIYNSSPIYNPALTNSNEQLDSATPLDLRGSSNQVDGSVAEPVADETPVSAAQTFDNTSSSESTAESPNIEPPAKTDDISNTTANKSAPQLELLPEYVAYINSLIEKNDSKNYASDGIFSLETALEYKADLVGKIDSTDIPALKSPSVTTANNLDSHNNVADAAPSESLREHLSGDLHNTRHTAEIPFNNIASLGGMDSFMQNTILHNDVQQDDTFII